MEPHAPTHTAGKIIISGVPSISCAIMDISTQGAALKVASVFGIPETFDLLIEANPARRHCKVIHKAPNKLEVLFQ